MADEEGLEAKPVQDGFELIEHAKKSARKDAEGLTEPEEDIMPVMMWEGPYGLGVMPLEDMADDEAKDRLAALMTTVLAVSRATQAIQVTTGWKVKVEKDQTPDDVLPVRDNPARQECISLMYMAHEPGKDRYVSGDITRFHDKPPVLGEWVDGFGATEEDDQPVERFGGRFGDAVHMGMDFAAEMPEQLVAIIDQGWADGEQEELVRRFHNVFSQFTSAMDAMREAGRG